MRICIVGKFPPIEGGVSRQTYWTAYSLARKGNMVWVVTNANEVEPEFKMALTSHDPKMLKLDFSNGGHLRVVSSNLPNEKLYIPWANPYVTKLASMATGIIVKNHCDLIFAYYFEPYGIAAYLASSWTGVPYVLKHAGSDIGRLLQQKELQNSYVEIIRRSRSIITSRGFANFFSKMGVAKKRLFFDHRSGIPTDYFKPKGEKMKINVDPKIFTIGIYGKLGMSKGSFDLLEALKILKNKGTKIHLLVLGGGGKGITEKFTDTVKLYKLDEDVKLLPFVSHWSVPKFIRAVDAICFLERDFPIGIHTPIIPREVLACGKCLILSEEIFEKQRYKDFLKDKDNFILVKNPKDYKLLANILEWATKNKNLVNKIGISGHEISQKIENFELYVEETNSMFSKLVKMTK